MLSPSAKARGQFAFPIDDDTASAGPRGSVLERGSEIETIGDRRRTIASGRLASAHLPDSRNPQGKRSWSVNKVILGR
jgi:hypothetical protein